MPRGSKDKYTDKQQRQAEHIEKGYIEQGMSKTEAQARAWATVNKEDGGGKRLGGSGRAQAVKPSTLGGKTRSTRKTVTRQKTTPRADSLERENMDELMRRARARNIPGRSSMRKRELIRALQAS